MSADEFFQKWNTRYADFDGQFGPQCKDLFNFYNRDVVKAPRTYGDAKDLWFRYPTKFYQRIANTITAVPRKGDVVIWLAWNKNPYGHVGICQSANMFWFTSFDQNFPLGTPCHFQRHNYLSPRVVGWLRPL